MSRFFTATTLLVTLFMNGQASAGYLFRLEKEGTTIAACVGGNLTLTCEGSNGSKFMWSLNGLTINQHDYKFIQKRNYSQLVIKEYKAENAGLYSCEEFDQRGGRSSETNLDVVTHAALNASIRIVHHQYYEDHLFFIQFTLSTDEKFSSSLSYAIEYKCDSSFDIYPLCVTRWQPVSRCDSNTTNSRTYYNCILLHSRVLLNFQYQLRATVKTACGRSENTTRFKVEIPNFSEPVQGLKAVAVDHRTVKLSWKRIDLLRDVGNFRTKNIQMVIKVLIQSGNASRYQSIMLKPSVNTTSLHGFLPLRNYTFAVTYHLIVSGLPLQSSKTAAPVTVHMPDIVTRSQPAVNASCVPLFNDTSKLFVISWRIPATPRNIGQNLETKISIYFSGTQMLFTVYQKAETSETFMFDATANTNVEISICNKAGCSNPTSTVCLYAQAQNENSGGRENTLLLTSCIVGLAVLVILVIASLYYLKKRYSNQLVEKPGKYRREKENENIEIVYPSVWHQYDEPAPQVQNYVDLSRAMVI